MKISQIDDPYGEFLKLRKIFQAGGIDRRGFRARLQGLCGGNTDLILRFNTVLPKKDQIKLKMTGVKRKKVTKKVEENRELPWDVLDNISKTLDIDDLFQFAGVCKNWRAFHKIYWRTFLASREPLLLRISRRPNEVFSLISIPDQKVYCLKKMGCLIHSINIATSNGYFIQAGYNNSFKLFNPFTRIKKVITVSTFQVNSSIEVNHALLALSKCSEDFVLVVLCKISRNLRVYQSRFCGWVTHSSSIVKEERIGKEERIVHFVVWQSIIYVITNKTNIGVLSLNSATIKFLKLKNTPNITSLGYKLVNCDEQLLVVDLLMNQVMNIYKIDFSNMNYVKLKTLGDIALFFASNIVNKNIYALSNPKRWGYESNSVYVTSLSSTTCRVYSWDDKKLQKCITLPTPDETGTFMFDWCFRHIQYEIDYSLVD